MSRTDRPSPSPEDSSHDGTAARPRTGALVLGLLVLTLACGVAAQWIPTANAAGGGPRHTTDPIVAPDGGPVRFSARIDREAVMDRGDGTVMVELTLRGADGTAGNPVRTPTDLVVVLDRSGSMEGQAIQHARASTRALIERLGPQDRFALVSYANGAQIEIPLAQASESATRTWLDRLHSIGAGGGTDMSSGLDLAHHLLSTSRATGRAARVILISDGHANQGEATPDGLQGRARRAVPSEYVLSAVGVGDGFDERLMTRIADAGTGNFYYVSDVSRLSSIFGDELLAARETVAQTLTIEMHPGAGVRLIEAAGYPMERHDDRVVVRPGALFAGQERLIWLTLSIDEERRQHAESEIDLGTFAVGYRTVEGTEHRLALGDTPAVRVVHDRAEFAAARDASAYVAQLRSEGLGQLRARVARAVADGDEVQASAAIEEFEAMNLVELRSLGVAEPEKEGAIAAALELKQEVAEALAPSAPAAAKNCLGKRLEQDAFDDRRQGAKR